MYAETRNAVTCTPLHQLNRASAPISSIAIDDGCQQVYIGFADGHIEEHKLHANSSHNWLVLTARKHVSNKVNLHSERLDDHAKNSLIMTTMASFSGCKVATLRH